MKRYKPAQTKNSGGRQSPRKLTSDFGSLKKKRPFRRNPQKQQDPYTYMDFAGLYPDRPGLPFTEGQLNALESNGFKVSRI